MLSLKKPMLHKKINNQGFTFVEVLVFTSILSFLLIALTSTVVTSLQRMQTVEHRLYAQRYAEELVEWLRSESEADWVAFVGHDAGSTGTLYCFNNNTSAIPPDVAFDFRSPAWPPPGACTAYNGVGTTAPLIYKRYALITQAGPNQVNIQIVVEWKDGTRYFTTPLNTVFTNAKEN